MDFHTYTTTREACKRSGAIEDPEDFYRVASADAVKMHSGQFLTPPFSGMTLSQLRPF